MNSPNPVYHNSAYRIDSIGDVYNDGISNVAISYGSPSDSGVFSIWTVNSRGFVNVDMGSDSYGSPHVYDDHHNSACQVWSDGAFGINYVNNSYGIKLSGLWRFQRFVGCEFTRCC